MNPKSLVAAVTVSAALAVGGCASAPPFHGTGRSPFDCKKNTCDVPVGYYFLGEIGIPDVIEIDAKTAGAKVTVTWTLSSIWGVTFADRGIVVDGPFTCERVGSSGLQYQCRADGKDLAAGKDYKYTVTLAGSFRPYPLDPYIRN